MFKLDCVFSTIKAVTLQADTCNYLKPTTYKPTSLVTSFTWFEVVLIYLCYLYLSKLF